MRDAEPGPGQRQCGQASHCAELQGRTLCSAIVSFDKRHCETLCLSVKISGHSRWLFDNVTT